MEMMERNVGITTFWDSQTKCNHKEDLRSKALVHNALQGGNFILIVM